LHTLREHPGRGGGWGGIWTGFEKDYRVTRAAQVAFCAENYFLQRAVALGLPGLFLYTGLCILFFRNVKRMPTEDQPDPWPRAALLAGGLAFYVQAQTYPAAEEAANYLLWILFALAECGRRSLRPGEARVISIGRQA
jgi:O-antigen ligase